MIGLDENKDEEQVIKQSINDMNALVATKNEQEIKIIISKLNKVRKKLLKSKIPIDIIRSAIISFLTQYHRLYLCESMETMKLVQILIKNFAQKELIKISLKNIDSIFKTPSPYRTMLSFKKKIKPEKDYLEVYFKIILLKKNIKDIIKGINSLLDIKNKNIDNQLERTDFQNPYGILFIRDLINELIINFGPNIESEKILQNVKKDMSHYYFLHCPKCFEIFNVDIIDKNISITCEKDKYHLIPNNINELKCDIKIKCINCEKKLEIYENNYKCIDCDEFFCENCAEGHQKIEPKNILINMYKTGYICQEHCELYTTFCALCKKNLCELCKDIHIHKVDQKIYEINEKEIELFTINKKETNKIDEFFLAELIAIYDWIKNCSYNNLSIRFGIWLLTQKKRIDEVNDKKFKFYFNNFFDDNFKKYYAKLIENASNGKNIFCQYLGKIRQNYKKNKIDIDQSYNDFKEFDIANRLRRYQMINDWNTNINRALSKCELYAVKIGLNNKILKLDNESKKLKSDIELLQIKIIALLKSNELYTSHLMKLVNRYLSDFLIRNIIKLYPSYLKPIKISLKNFYEIANNFPENLFKNENISFLGNLKNQLELDESFIDLSQDEKNNKIKLFIETIKDSNTIMFINPIKIGDDIFNINELNFILNMLFYFKFKGNITAHMNISPDESIKLKKIKSEIPNLEPFLNNLKLNGNFNGNNKEKKANNVNININNNINNNENIINGFNSIIQKNKTKNENCLDIGEKIIENINQSKIDWLEIENEVIDKIQEIILDTKEQIISDFYDICIKKELKINVILDCILNEDYRNIFKIDPLFNRRLIQDFDELIKNEKPNFYSSQYEEIKENIFKSNNYINTIEKLVQSFKNLKIDINENIYMSTKNFIKKYLEKLCSKNTETNIISFNNDYDLIIINLNECFQNIKFFGLEDLEKNSIIMSLLLDEIKSVEINNFNALINDCRKYIKANIILENVRRTLEDSHSFIKENINKKIDNNTNLIENTKDFIKKYNYPQNNDVCNININEKRIEYIIKKLFGNQSLDWSYLENSDITLDSFLFNNQNIV